MFMKFMLSNWNFIMDNMLDKMGVTGLIGHWDVPYLQIPTYQTILLNVRQDFNATDSLEIRFDINV